MKQLEQQVRMNKRHYRKQKNTQNGHVMRMEDCRIVGQVAEWNPQVKRWRGLPVNTWGLRTACKEGISRMKNVLIEGFGERKLCL
jgi:hypothetical protein